MPRTKAQPTPLIARFYTAATPCPRCKTNRYYASTSTCVACAKNAVYKKRGKTRYVDDIFGDITPDAPATPTPTPFETGDDLI